MALRLKSVSKDPRLPYALKALLFGASLLLIGKWGFILAIYFYINPLLRTLKFLFPFLVFLIAGFGLFLQTPPQYQLLSAAFLSMLFYFLLVIKNLAVVDRVGVYFVFSALTLFMVFIFYPSPLFVFFASAAIFSYLLKRRELIWVSALLIAQTLWAVKQLPIGALQTANIALVVVIFLQTIVLRYKNGLLNKKELPVFLFLAAALALFATFASHWTI